MSAMAFGWVERDELRTAYDDAVENGAESFMFHDTELLVDYAKYLLEYLDMKLK